ncbi:hypothetical protein LSCM1_00079 [Leishmania martiniquensis]|uniref:Uncharacterized protein n=1 Tax=Leishmania martiniquensis TaxID=1580590 RepID=A0A836FY55_9TRYP|nr:hypothetical protein LSCM1_00079 [Leishmania martiniquensis]
MSTHSNTFSTYIDHLILLLAARFHAPLDVSAESLLASGVNASEQWQSSWELVARTVQQALGSPQTEQERRLLRQLDVHLFSASVCRERARYMQWKLQENQRRCGDKQQLSLSPAVPSEGPTNVIADAAVSDSVGGQPYDVTRRSLHDEVRSLYALVRQSLPTTLGDSESEEEGDAQTTSAQSAALGTGPSPFARVREVFVRTSAEQERDEQVARARDEFLSEVQALQSAYYDKYRRWMDVPASILDPPPAASKEVVSATGALAAPERTARARDVDSEGVASREVLGAAASQPLRLRAQANRTNGSAAADGSARSEALASLFQQVQLRRPLRPSAMPDDVLEKMYRARADSEGGPESRSRTSGWRSSALSASTSTTSSLARAPADTIVSEAAAAAPSLSQPSSLPAAARKETAPPASRRGRWQIVEYDEDDDDST